MARTPRASVLSNFTEPLPPTPRSAASSTTGPTSPPSTASSASTIPLPPTPKSTAKGGSAFAKGKGGNRGNGQGYGAEGGEDSHADSPRSPLTPVSTTRSLRTAAQSKGATGDSSAKGKAIHSSNSSNGVKGRKPMDPTDNLPTPGKEVSTGGVTRRTWKHNTARIAALSLSIPISLILVLTRLLLQPIYNSTPLSLHTSTLYATWTVLATLLIWHSSRHTSARLGISARVCLCVSAIGGDIVAISGRKVGSLAGRLGGPEWGALAARGVLGMTVVGGGIGFAALCYDHIYPISSKPDGKARHVSTVVQLLPRLAFYAGHIWLGERLWLPALSGSISMLVQSPERSILFLSLLLTLLSLFVRSPPPTSTSFARSLHTAIITRFNLSQSSSNNLWTVLSRLPRNVFPILLLLRLPLLIIALRQQIFLRPSPPYLAANGQVRIISSERGITGQIVVGDEMSRGFRFLRCDASILGGRWMRSVKLPIGGSRTDLGDSIFATFPLQEIGLLAYRTDESESIARTISMTTGLQVGSGSGDLSEGDKPADRALMIGLGVGIAAQAFSYQNIEIDLVEIDPLVYNAAVDHFNLTLPAASSTINLLDGNEYVRSLADMRREGTYTGQKWRYVIQDCFSGGSVPNEMFTREFWGDLKENVEQDGIVAMNFVGVLRSRASKAVLVTLTSMFEQCRAFGDPAENHVDEDQSINMVVFCTDALSALLTFRRPTPADVRRSPLRSHVYSTSQANEIQLHDVISAEDRVNPEYTLKRGEGKMTREGWQVGSGLSMWWNMQKILTPEMWMTF